MKVITKGIPIIVNQQCDKCDGYMERINPYIVFTTYPLQYPHKCNKCEYTKNYTKSYPYSEIISKEEYDKIIRDKNFED